MQRHRDTATHIFTDFGWDVLPAQGGMFLTANIMSEDSETFVRDLLHKTGVLVAPDKLFVSERGNGDFVRIAFNRSEGVLDKAARRLAGSVVA
nr:aminotransferase class I/II-fold pyridoxal phosphate-dependent enzyme [Lentzea tibetensis]